MLPMLLSVQVSIPLMNMEIVKKGGDLVTAQCFAQCSALWLSQNQWKP